MVVLEAMAHGLPVVVSDAQYCGIAALLDDGANAFIMRNPKDAQELSGLLRRLIEDGPLRVRLGRAATVFSQAHQWPEIARQQEAIYASVCAVSV